MTERRRRRSLPEQVQDSAKKKVKKPKTNPDGFLSTGSTMLNLAFSDSIKGGWPVGRISTVPGQSSAGKTLLTLSTFCEAAIDPRFDGYELIYDDVERRCDFDLEKLFPPLVNRLKTPGGVLYSELGESDEEPGISNTTEDVELRLAGLAEKSKSFVYVADSLDALSIDEEAEKEMLRALAAAKSREAANKIAQVHNARKAGTIHRILRNMNGFVANTKSVLILTQQLKQKIDAKPFERKWKTNGGEGPYFYSHVRPYLTKGKTYKKKEREIGNCCKIIMDKNSVTGKLRNVEFDIFYDLGIDDVGSMVEFLLAEKHWKSGSWIEAPEFDLRENGRDKLIRAIEDHGYERRLQKLVEKIWLEIEDSLKLERKSRYA